MEEVTIRQENNSDLTAISNVNRCAFAGEGEAEFVSSIRGSSHFVRELSLVAEFNGRIIGHILMFKTVLHQQNGDVEVLALAPMSVMPSQSHRGVGSALVRAAMSKAVSLGYPAVVVVGHPEYYAKFAFEPAVKWGVEVSLSVPEDSVSVRELISGSLTGGELEYPGPFLKMFEMLEAG